MPDKKGRMNGREEAFVEAYAETGNRHFAAQKAGYSNPTVSASQLLARPAVVEAVALRAMRLSEENALTAYKVLAEAMASDKAPWGVRVNAAKISLADYTAKSMGAVDAADVAEMTGDQLRVAAAQIQAQLAALAMPTLDLVAEEVSTQPDTSEDALFE